MADNTFRSYRSHDPLARGQAGSRAPASDPLAELARLIGQSDPYAEPAARRDHSQSGDTAAPGHDWAADESYATADDRPEEHYAPPPLAAAYQPYDPQEPAYEDEAPTGGRFFSGPAATFSGFREDVDAYDDHEPPPALPARQAPAYATAADDGYEDQPEHDTGEAYAGDDYYDEAPSQSPRRRGALVGVIAILSLAVIGTAGAFGYRAMFGGSVLPTLPPIIKASNGPNKIVPNAGEAQANSSSQAGAATTGSTENLVSREEQPVNMEPPKAAPRVVSTIPIITGQGSLPPGMGAPDASGQVASTPNANWPPPPSPGGAAPPAAAALPAQLSAEPKKIHTVTIRADQAGGAATPAAAPAVRSSAHPAPSAAKPTTMASAPPAGANGPLSIVPGSQAEAAAPAPQVRTHVAAAHTAAMAGAAPVTAVAAPAAAGGGYAVQVTSQRSEAEAQAAFRTLKAKYPSQLAGREPIIRRADLGDKGTYYRALVGPFASAEEAAGICSGMKAAGGSCIVQRN